MAGIRSVEDVRPHVQMRQVAGCSCARVAAAKSLFVGGAIEATPTASEHAQKIPAANGKEKLGGAIRQPHGDVPCTPSEIVATVLDSAA
jgi:hypothetical protein